MEPVVILVALLAGLVFHRLGYPPLPGYLLAGFACHALGFGDLDIISTIADLGITLLLFTIGLKLNVKELLAPQVWGVAGLQMIIAIPLTALVILASGVVFPALALQNTSSAWTLALALSFSSTVFAVKMFEDRGETTSLHANIAIGVLVLQDLVAVTYLVVSSNALPGPAALLLLALPLLRPAFLFVLSLAGHGELVTLFGMTVALGAGELFEAFHLKAGLGALVMGIVLGNSAKSKELYGSLIQLKDLFLIGFFLQIGYYGLPSTPMILAAVALSMIVFVRPFIYYLLFVTFRLRARTALLAGASLFNYSEFGLIVASIAVSHDVLSVEWLTTLALSVSISFFVATPFNARIHGIYNRYYDLLTRFERRERLPEEVQGSLGDAEIVILGMGRVGRGAYAYLDELYPGNIVGVDQNLEKAQEHRQAGINCAHGDATDHDFWEMADLAPRKLILVSLTNHAENLTVVKLARAFQFQNTLAVVSRYPDEQAELEALGCVTFNLYGEAGHGFAEHVMNAIASS